MQQLQRDYIFEFAGMPQSGKTTVKDILVHYLKRMEYPFQEYHGGSRYSLLYDAPIAELNVLLARNARHFVSSIIEREKADYKVYVLDRGLIDRCIFTDALVRSGKVAEEQAKEIYASLTSPDLLEKLDGVYIFVTSPETALIREYRDKLVRREDVRSEGEVMNESFLSQMRSAAIEGFDTAKHRVRNVKRIDTEQLGVDMRTKAREVFDNIRNTYPELNLKLNTRWLD